MQKQITLTSYRGFISILILLFAAIKAVATPVDNFVTLSNSTVATQIGTQKRWKIDVDLPGQQTFYNGFINLYYRGTTGSDAAIGGFGSFKVAWTTSSNPIFYSKGRIVELMTQSNNRYETSDLSGYEIESNVQTSLPGHITIYIKGIGIDPPSSPPIVTTIFTNFSEQLPNSNPSENVKIAEIVRNSIASPLSSGQSAIEFDLPGDCNFYAGQLSLNYRGTAGSDAAIGGTALYNIVWNTSDNSLFYLKGRVVDLVSSTNNQYETSDLNGYKIVRVESSLPRRLKVILQATGVNAPQSLPSATVTFTGTPVSGDFSTRAGSIYWGTVPEFSKSISIVESKTATNVVGKWNLEFDLPSESDFYSGTLELSYRGTSGSEAALGGIAKYNIVWTTSDNGIFYSLGRRVVLVSASNSQYETSDFSGYSIESIVGQSPRHLTLTLKSTGVNPPSSAPNISILYHGITSNRQSNWPIQNYRNVLGINFRGDFTTVDLLAAAKFKHIRQDINWGEAEPRKGEYFRPYNAQFWDYARNQYGMTFLGILNDTNKVYNESNKHGWENVIPPVAFSNFAAAMDGLIKADAYEVLNEPPALTMSGLGCVDPYICQVWQDPYLNLLEAVRNKIKLQNNNIPITNAGLINGPYGWATLFGGGYTALNYITETIAPRAFGLTDVMNLHSYPAGGDVDPGAGQQIKHFVNTLGKRVWITEMGVAQHTDGDYFQARRLLSQLFFLFSVGAERVYIYAAEGDYGNESNAENFQIIAKYNGGPQTPRPSYNSIKKVSDFISETALPDHPDYQPIISPSISVSGPSDLLQFLVTGKGNSSALVLWRSAWTENTSTSVVTISGRIKPGSVEILRPIGNSVSTVPNSTTFPITIDFGGHDFVILKFQH